MQKLEVVQFVYHNYRQHRVQSVVVGMHYNLHRENRKDRGTRHIKVGREFPNNAHYTFFFQISQLTVGRICSRHAGCLTVAMYCSITFYKLNEINT